MSAAQRSATVVRRVVDGVETARCGVLGVLRGLGLRLLREGVLTRAARSDGRLPVADLIVLGHGGLRGLGAGVARAAERSAVAGARLELAQLTLEVGLQ